MKTNMPARPVLSQEEAFAIGKRILTMTTADEARVRIEHQSVGVTRVNRRRVCASQDRETVKIMLSLKFGTTTTGAGITVNQLDDDTLRAVVPYLENLAKAQLRPAVNIFKGMYDAPNRPLIPVQLWHESTVEAAAQARTEVLPNMLALSKQANFDSAIFIGAIARASCVMTSRGQASYNQLTDSEVTATCWTDGGRASGWGGVAGRDWASLDPESAMRDAVELTKRSANAQALEPGRRTAILGPAAVAQLATQMGYAFNAVNVLKLRSSPFASPDGSNPVGKTVMDPRVSIISNPADLDGGYSPFLLNEWVFHETDGLPQFPNQWVENGVLKRLQFDPISGAAIGVADVSDVASSLRIETDGEKYSVEEMIARCDSGVYVNRLTGVSLTDHPSGMMSGVTTGGCFLVKNGKVDRPLKNFRFVDSPFFSLNSLELIGEAHRTALGYPGNIYASWPLPPVIVPPLMVRDFNFAALADVV